MEIKTSLLKLADVELKFKGDSGQFEGYASKFGGVDSYGDTILPGAFSQTLVAHGTPKMFFNHKLWDLPIGKWLDAKEDDQGLYVAGELTPGVGDNVRAALKHATVDGLSVGGFLADGDYDETEDDHRTIRKWTRLAEISVVTFPADGAARIDLASVKTALADMQTLHDLERYLRDAGGFSKSAATAIVSRARSLFDRRDADDGAAAKREADHLALLALRLRTMHVG